MLFPITAQSIVQCFIEEQALLYPYSIIRGRFMFFSYLSCGSESTGLDSVDIHWQRSLRISNLHLFDRNKGEHVFVGSLRRHRALSMSVVFLVHAEFQFVQIDSKPR